MSSRDSDDLESLETQTGAVPTVPDLITKAQHCLSLKEEPLLDQLIIFEEYSAAFQYIEANQALSEIDRDILEELQKLHAQILKRAQELQHKLKGQMISHQTRGKAMMSYLDLLPRRISSVKPRKG